MSHIQQGKLVNLFLLKPQNTKEFTREQYASYGNKKLCWVFVAISKWSKFTAYSSLIECNRHLYSDQSHVIIGWGSTFSWYCDFLLWNWYRVYMCVRFVVAIKAPSFLLAENTGRIWLPLLCHLTQGSSICFRITIASVYSYHSFSCFLSSFHLSCLFFPLYSLFSFFSFPSVLSILTILSLVFFLLSMPCLFLPLFFLFTFFAFPSFFTTKLNDLYNQHLRLAGNTKQNTRVTRNTNTPSLYKRLLKALYSDVTERTNTWTAPRSHPRLLPKQGTGKQWAPEYQTKCYVLHSKWRSREVYYGWTGRSNGTWITEARVDVKIKDCQRVWRMHADVAGRLPSCDFQFFVEALRKKTEIIVYPTEKFPYCLLLIIGKRWKKKKELIYGGRIKWFELMVGMKTCS